MRIAVIGSGIAGNSAAWALSERHDVTLYEKRARPGGHSATVDIDYDGTSMAVDTGFIVYNELNYPNLTALFDHLGVATEASDMSFSFSLDGGVREWSGCNLGTIFGQRRNIVSLRFMWMLREILRFNRMSVADRASGYLNGLSLADYLARRKFSPCFASDYLLPMGAAIWSTPPATCWPSRRRTSSPSSRTTAWSTATARSGARSPAAVEPMWSACSRRSRAAFGSRRRSPK